MNLSLSSGVGPITTAEPPLGKGEKAAREFESVLLTSLFDALQKSFAFDAKDDTAGASDYRLMGTRALAEAVSERGGFGIARLILAHLRLPGGSGEGGTEVPPLGSGFGARNRSKE